MRVSLFCCIGLFGPLASPCCHGQILRKAVVERLMAAGRPEAEPTTNAETGGKTPELIWRTRDSLPGQALGFQEGTLEWATSFLAQPAKLRAESLLLWQEPVAASLSQATEPWRLRLKNGDVLAAKEIRQMPEGVVVQSESLGKVLVREEQLHSAFRCQGERILYAGPQGGVGWRSEGFFPVAGAGLATQKWNALAKLSTRLPDRVSARVVIRSLADLQFALGVGEEEGVHPTLEVWDRDLVLVIRVEGDLHFRPVMELTAEPQVVSVTLGWDRMAREAKVWDDTGKELAALRITPPGKPGEAKDQAVSLRNLGANVILEELVLRPWDGKTRARGKPALMKRGQRVDWSAQDELRWTNEPFPYTAPPTQPRAMWWDGSCITGRLERITAERLMLQPEWSSVSVSAPRRGLWRLFFGQEPVRPPPEDRDLLTLGQQQVNGHLEGSPGATAPLWRLPGAVEAVPIQPKEEPLIQLRPASGLPQRGALLFLSNGEVFRGELRGLGEDKLQVKLPHFEGSEIPLTHARAMHWSDVGGELRGFRDPAWQAKAAGEKQPEVTQGDTPAADTLRLPPGASHGHPRVAVAGGIEFVMETEEGWGGVELCLFATDLDGTNRDAFLLTLFFSGDQVYAQAKGHQRGQTSGQSVRVSKDITKFKVWREMDTLKVTANGAPLLSAPIDRIKPQGEGLILRSGSMWGNNQRPVTVTDFRTTPSTGELPVLNASATAKAEALTIPRFRRETLPKHLLVALNGDVVRGRIEQITDGFLRFTAGVESLDIPRSRVRALVWPQLPDAKPLATVPSEGLWLTLHDGSTFALKVTEFGPTEVAGQSSLLGACRVPLRSISKLAWSAGEVSPAVKSHLEWPMSYAAEPVLPEKEESPLLGKVAPGFKLPMLYEGDFKLEEKRGQVVVLDFWASWCGPCVRSMPDLLELAKEYEEKEVYFLAVNQSEPATVVKRFIETRGWKLNVALDSLGGTALKYAVEGIPHTVVIDAKGTVSAVFVGASPDGKNKLKAAIDAAIAKHQEP